MRFSGRPSSLRLLRWVVRRKSALERERDRCGGVRNPSAIYNGSEAVRL
jgi:hypothetical protein